MRLTWKMSIASMKMFFRQKEAILWTILLPLFMVFLFSFVSFDGFNTISLGVVNRSNDTAFVSAIKSVKALKMYEGTYETELQALTEGDRVLVVVLPPTFHPGSSDTVRTLLNARKPQEGNVAALLVQRVLDELTFQQSVQLTRPEVIVETVNSRNLTYIDFLLPGILSMSIMQSGVFGVAFGFVLLKKRGILRRLLATPMKPGDFIVAQVATRLIVLIAQVLIMIGAGIFFFDLHFQGNILNLLVVGILGGIVFLAIGFALSGLSKSEDQVAPLANIITLPMMLLSGVFFSRSNLPGFAHVITDFFPLTYLADGMRSITIEGASLVDIGGDLLGLTVWAVVSVFLAVKAFRWE